MFHLEAGIAAQHAVASSVETTDWPEIARLYDLLYAKKPTPVVALSRAIAQMVIDGDLEVYRLSAHAVGALEIAATQSFFGVGSIEMSS